MSNSQSDSKVETSDSHRDQGVVSLDRDLESEGTLEDEGYEYPSDDEPDEDINHSNSIYAVYTNHISSTPTCCQLLNLTGDTLAYLLTWLSIEELSRIDIAVCNKAKRRKFLDYIGEKGNMVIYA